MYSFRISTEDTTASDIGSHVTASPFIHITRSPALWPAPVNSMLYG